LHNFSPTSMPIKVINPSASMAPRNTKYGESNFAANVIAESCVL
jgi:hypothetical protein